MQIGNDESADVSVVLGVLELLAIGGVDGVAFDAVDLGIAYVELLAVDEGILRNSAEGFETVVKYGECIGVKIK